MQISAITTMLMVDVQIATMISNNEKVSTDVKTEVRKIIGISF